MTMKRPLGCWFICLCIMASISGYGGEPQAYDLCDRGERQQHSRYNNTAGIRSRRGGLSPTALLEGGAKPIAWGSRRSRWRRWWTGPRGGVRVGWNNKLNRGGPRRWRLAGQWTRGGHTIGSYFKALILMNMMIHARGSLLGGGHDVQEIGGGWIIRRAEEAALLMLVEKILRVSENFHGKVLKNYEKNKTRRNARLNGEAGQILKVADQAQLIILNAIRHKVKCQC